LVHTFYNNGLFIALDVNSGSIHLVEEVVHQILKEFPRALPEYHELFVKFGAVCDAETL
jgi:hypothetical protein